MYYMYIHTCIYTLICMNDWDLCLASNLRGCRPPEQGRDRYLESSREAVNSSWSSQPRVSECTRAVYHTLHSEQRHPFER